MCYNTGRGGVTLKRVAIRGGLCTFTSQWRYDDCMHMYVYACARRTPTLASCLASTATLVCTGMYGQQWTCAIEMAASNGVLPQTLASTSMRCVTVETRSSAAANS
jgi:hypothetical protein